MNHRTQVVADLFVFSLDETLGAGQSDIQMCDD